MVAMLVTVILTAALAVPVGSALKNTTPVYDNIYETVEGTIKENGVVDKDTLSNLNLPLGLQDKITDGTDVVDSFSEYVATQITDTAFNAIIFIVLFIIIYIILQVVIHVLDFVAKLPLLKEVNKLGGFAIGVIQGLLIVWVACLILTACSGKPWAQDLFAQINDNQILSFIYNNNLIVWIVTNIL